MVLIGQLKMIDDKRLIQSYLSEIKQQKSASTFKTYTHGCTELLEYFELTGKNLYFITTQQESNKYIEYLHKRGLSERTICNRISVLRSFLKLCIRNKYIPENNLYIKNKERNENVDYASQDEVRTLYQFCLTCDEYDDYQSARGKTITLFVLLFGLKASEIINLKIRDITLSGKELANCSMIRFIYDVKAVPILELYLKKRTMFLSGFDQSCDSLFVNRFGQPLSINTVHSDFEMIRNDTGLTNVTLSALRNACIDSYYKALPDKVIISRIFQITKNRIQQMQSRQMDS